MNKVQAADQKLFFFLVQLMWWWRLLPSDKFLAYSIFSTVHESVGFGEELGHGNVVLLLMNRKKRK